ncbi:MAG: ECF transporter S component [Clostridiales bacterium]|nr:ECF transporter S component [Clostridiales bacterium]MDY2901746.1 ECF transporter S component [Christensenellaceae bacterium]
MDKEIKEENATGEKKEETKSGKKEAKSPFTAKKLALIAAFTALAFGASFLDFPVFPAAPFLKLDFSFAIMLIAAYMLGALSGEMTVIIFTLFRLPLSQTGMIGELANFIMAQFFVVIPSLIYERKRKFSVVTITLTAATLIISAVSLLINRYLLFPFYMQGGAAAFFADVWYLIVLFNLIKGASNAVITVLLYKRLKKILHKFL